MTEADWDVGAVNDARIEMMQQSEDTRFHPRGVIAIDAVLIDKTGKFIKPYFLYGGTFGDHSEKRYKHAQDLIVVNYLNPIDGKHYPLEFRRFKKESQCEWTGDEFKKMTELKPVSVKNFVVLPKRWIVERIFAWINKFRRNSKDYERNPDSSRAMIHIAMTIRMLHLLEKQNLSS